MPSKSNKQEIKELCLVLWGSADLFLGSEDDEEDIATFMWLLELCRYSMERSTIPKSSAWISTVLCSEDFDDKRFRSQLRMERQAFVNVLSLIRGKSSTESPSFV
jgi:hypothetical protein